MRRRTLLSGGLAFCLLGYAIGSLPTEQETLNVCEDHITGGEVNTVCSYADKDVGPFTSDEKNLLSGVLDVFHSLEGFDSVQIGALDLGSRTYSSHRGSDGCVTYSNADSVYITSQGLSDSLFMVNDCPPEGNASEGDYLTLRVSEGDASLLGRSVCGGALSGLRYIIPGGSNPSINIGFGSHADQAELIALFPGEEKAESSDDLPCSLQDLEEAIFPYINDYLGFGLE